MPSLALIALLQAILQEAPEAIALGKSIFANGAPTPEELEAAAQSYAAALAVAQADVAPKS